MNVLLKKEPVNRVNVALKKFNESFNIIVLNSLWLPFINLQVLRKVLNLTFINIHLSI